METSQRKEEKEETLLPFSFTERMAIDERISRRYLLTVSFLSNRRIVCFPSVLTLALSKSRDPRDPRLFPSDDRFDRDSGEEGNASNKVGQV